MQPSSEQRLGYFAWQSVCATSWVARLAPTSRYERAVAAQAPRENERAAETTTIFLSFQDLGADSWRRSSAGTVLYKAIGACDGRLCSLLLPLQIGKPLETNET